jgi:hypothetical protein
MSSSAGSKMPSKRRLGNAAFAGRKRSLRKASVGLVAGQGASTASAPADSGRPGVGGFKGSLQRLGAANQLHGQCVITLDGKETAALRFSFGGSQINPLDILTR